MLNELGNFFGPILQITVHHYHQFTGHFSEPRVQGERFTAIPAQMNALYSARIFFSECVEDSLRTIGASIIYKNYLIAPKQAKRCSYAFRQRTQRIAFVEDWYNN